MPVLADALGDLNDVLSSAGDTVDAVVNLDVPKVITGVGSVVEDAVDVVTNLAGNVLGSTDPTTTIQTSTTHPSSHATTSTSSVDSSYPGSSSSVSVSSVVGKTSETASTSEGSSSGGTSLTGRPPSVTGLVQPNPVALPHDDGSTNVDGTTSPNSGTGGTSNDNPTGGKSSLPPAAIAGISVVAVALSMAILLCLVRCHFIRRRQTKRQAWAQRMSRVIEAPVSNSTAADVTVRRASAATIGSFISTHESSLFSDQPPVPSWNLASKTQQRRAESDSIDSNSAENFGTFIPDGRFNWTSSGGSSSNAAAGVQPHGSVLHEPNVATSSGDVPMSQTKSGWSTSTSSERLSTSNDSSLFSWSERSPTPTELPARSSSHLSGEFEGLPAQAFAPAGSTMMSTGQMTQVLGPPIAVPLHMIVPSQMSR